MTNRPSLTGVPQLSSRRLRSNSGGPLPQDLGGLSPAEMNSVAPPSPVYKIVLTGGPCGGKTTSLARVSCFKTTSTYYIFHGLDYMCNFLTSYYYIMNQQHVFFSYPHI